MLPESIKIGKIEIPPASFQHSEVKMPLEPESSQAGCLDFYREENYKPGILSVYPRVQLVLIPSQVQVPLYHGAKLKWNQWKEICKEGWYDEKMCETQRIS